MTKLTCRPVSGQFFTFPSQTLLFFIALVSFCYFPGAFSFILCLHRGGSERAQNRRVSQHGSVSFVSIRFSQRGALKANSETSLLALRTKSGALPSLFTPLSPFTNRYLSRSDCMGLFFFQRRWHIKMIERNIYWAFLRSLEVLLFVKKAFKEQINCIHSIFLLLFVFFVSLSPSRSESGFHGAVVFCHDERYQGYSAKRLCATIY